MYCYQISMDICSIICGEILISDLLYNKDSHYLFETDDNPVWLDNSTYIIQVYLLYAIIDSF